MRVFPGEDNNFVQDTQRLFSMDKTRLVDSILLLDEVGKDPYNSRQFEKLLNRGFDRALIYLQLFLIIKFVENRGDATLDLQDIISNKEKV